MMSFVRWLSVVVAALALAFAHPALAAKKKKKSHSSKSWPSKKHHHKAKPSKHGVSTPAPAPGEAPADENNEDESDDEEAKSDDKSDKSDKKAKSEAASEDEDGEGQGDESDTVVSKKAHRAAAAEEESGAPVALELSVGPRAVHRTFNYNDPLSQHNAAANRPYSYKLGAAPAPFVEVGLYPVAFGSRSFISNIGLIGGFERIIGTTTVYNPGTPDEIKSTTLGQQFYAGLRGRLPFGDNEVGLSAAYGKHTFRVRDDATTQATEGVVPNVDYTFVMVGLDARFTFDKFLLGLHGGTRIVTDPGSIKKDWFPSAKTQAIEGGLQLGYRLTPMFDVLAGADILRYAFNFNPVPTGNNIVAGGAVDQYLSGWLALRVRLLGS
jgi:hypothetical protein